MRAQKWWHPRGQGAPKAEHEGWEPRTVGGGGGGATCRVFFLPPRNFAFFPLSVDLLVKAFNMHFWSSSCAIHIYGQKKPLPFKSPTMGKFRNGGQNKTRNVGRSGGGRSGGPAEERSRTKKRTKKLEEKEKRTKNKKHKHGLQRKGRNNYGTQRTRKRGNKNEEDKKKQHERKVCISKQVKIASLGRSNVPNSAWASTRSGLTRSGHSWSGLSRSAPSELVILNLLLRTTNRELVIENLLLRVCKRELVT